MAHSLETYPELKTWYQNQRHSIPKLVTEPSLYLSWHICKWLDIGCIVDFEQFASEFYSFLNIPNQLKEQFKKVESFFNQYDLTLTTVFGHWGSAAIINEQGPAFYQLMEDAAKKLNDAPLCFLSAWGALNSNKLEECIRISQIMEEDYAPMLTIRGQAQLELGYCNDAINSLDAALELSPHDPLIWYQLAKAELVLGHLEKAWMATSVCDKICPCNEDVAILYTLIATDKLAQNDEWFDVAWQALQQISQEANEQNQQLLYHMMLLAFAKKEKTWAEEIITKINWLQVEASWIQNKQLSTILKQLGDLQWYDLSSIVLKQITNHE